MNHFFALTLPPTVREQLAQTAAEWRRLLPPDVAARWYGAGDCHITLKFLGDVDLARRQELFEAVAPVAARATPFALTLAPVGGFPDLKRPFVLWAGVQSSDALTHLAAQIDEATAALGFARERRPYRPHITLARCRAPRRAQPLPTPCQREQAFADWQADAFTLMQTRTPQERQNGPNHRYNTVHTFPFGDTHSSPAF